MKTLVPRRAAGCALLLTALACSQAAGGELLRNGGMAPPYEQGLPAGWEDNSYGTLERSAAVDATSPHSGPSALRIQCTSFAAGDVQVRQRGLAVEKGQPYTIRLWMKGALKSRVLVALRRNPPPYTQYVRASFAVRPEWRPFVFTGVASGSDADAGLYIAFQGVGELVIDDVSLVVGAVPEPDPVYSLPPRKGNRVYDSGFDAGPEGWTSGGGLSLSAAAAHTGTLGAQLAAGTVECRPFPVEPYQLYTVSVWARSPRPRVRLDFGLVEWADEGGDSPGRRDRLSSSVTLSPEWRRYEISGVPHPLLWAGYVLQAQSDGLVEIDDVQVEEGTLTDYRPAAAIEAGVASSPLFTVVGAPAEVEVRVAGVASTATVPLRYTLENLWSAPLESRTVTVVGPGPHRLAVTPSSPGMHRVRVEAAKSPATGEAAFGVFPARDRRPRPESPFGIHVAASPGAPTNTMLAATAAGARWVRLHDFGDYTHWYQVEPEPGWFVWRDAEVDGLLARGFTILANLGHPPPWAGREEREPRGWAWTASPPRSLAEWESYVQRTVEHYRGRIRYWEIWNEPYVEGFFRGTPEEYVDLLAAAFRAIKQVDPESVVIGGCFSPYAEDWTQRVIAAGGLAYMDALSYHQYWAPAQTLGGAPGEPPEIVRNIRRSVDLMLERGRLLPIYMTEGGVTCPPFVSWLPEGGFTVQGVEAAASLVRGMTEMISSGVVNVDYYYAGGETGAMPWFSAMTNGAYVMTDYAGRPKPTMMAYSALEQVLDGASPAGSWVSGDLSVYSFAKGAGSVAVVWGAPERTLAVPGARVLDMMGAPLAGDAAKAQRDEPLFLLAPQTPPDRLRKLLGGAN